MTISIIINDAISKMMVAWSRAKIVEVVRFGEIPGKF